VARSDVVIDNFAHGAVEARGVGYDVLTRTNPGIVYLFRWENARSARSCRFP
jgi:crotonobetainyl-CoA:carnitine CoA-transferase CaiB-like acyl-CoA transferase